MNKQGSGSDTTKAKEKTGKGKEDPNEEIEKGGVKRSRSQRSLVDVERGMFCVRNCALRELP